MLSPMPSTLPLSHSLSIPSLSLSHSFSIPSLSFSHSLSHTHSSPSSLSETDSSVMLLV